MRTAEKSEGKMISVAVAPGPNRTHAPPSSRMKSRALLFSYGNYLLAVADLSNRPYGEYL